MCAKVCVRVVLVAGLPSTAVVFIDLERSPDGHIEVFADASFIRRGSLTSAGARAIDGALAGVDPTLNLRTARTCAEHAAHAVAV